MSADMDSGFKMEQAEEVASDYAGMSLIWITPILISLMYIHLMPLRVLPQTLKVTQSELYNSKSS